MDHRVEVCFSSGPRSDSRALSSLRAVRSSILTQLAPRGTLKLLLAQQGDASWLPAFLATLLGFNLVGEPRARVSPMALGRAFRNTQHRGGFLNCHADEIAQLDEF